VELEQSHAVFDPKKEGEILFFYKKRFSILDPHKFSAQALSENRITKNFTSAKVSS